MFASLSIYGLWAYNSEVFDNLALPTGIDRDGVITQILTDCSDFALLYPNYDFMKMLIGVWSQKEQKIWENLYKSENIEYNPIENYDRHETLTRNVSSRAEGRNQSSSTSTGSSSSSSEAGKTAYDSDTIKNVSAAHGADQSASTSSGSESGENTSSGVETVTNHTHGNIGVTTAQQMIEGFREVSKFCTYDYIVQSFKDRFCVQVY